MKYHKETVENYAKKSGDFNPVHRDLDFCRESFLGSPIVHGTFLINELLNIIPKVPKKLTCFFHLPVYVGELYYWEIIETGRKIVDEYGNDCVVFKFSGETDKKVLESTALVLLNISKFVGMEKPGPGALIRSIEIDFIDKKLEPKYSAYKRNKFTWNVHVDDGFVTAMIVATKVPEPLEIFQKPTICKSEYVGVAPRVLVIGGTGSIGRAFVKQYLKSGWEVEFTCRPTSNLTIIEHLQRWGATAKKGVYDLEKLTEDYLSSFDKIVYCVTPRIRQENGQFNYELFHNYLEYYMKIPLTIMPRMKDWADFISIGSEFEDEVVASFYNYAMAKRTSNSTLKSLATKFRVRFLSPKFPKLLTNQTNTIIREPDLMTPEEYLPRFQEKLFYK